MTPPRFDRLAPHYRRLEAATFGPLLHWCRTALLDQLGDARRVVILGEGDGRFLADFLHRNRAATVDVIDASPAMNALAKSRVEPVPGASGRVRFHRADARAFDLPRGIYDLAVTNFFLDCFPASELGPLVDRIADSLTPGGRWLVGDFARPARPIHRAPARVALAVMYACFRLETRIAAGSLVDPRPLLRARGLGVLGARRRLGGFLVSELWGQSDGPGRGVRRTLS